MLIAFVICLICYVGALLAENFNVSIAGIFSAIYAVMFSGVQAGTPGAPSVFIAYGKENALALKNSGIEGRFLALK